MGIGAGTIQITGSMEIYLADKSIFDKFVANTNTSIIFSSIDNSGNGYIFTLPQVAYTSLKTNASGKDQDQMLSVQFTAMRDISSVQALADTTLQKAVFIDRVGVAAT